MIKEEETLKNRLISSIQTCRTEMEKLCLELHRATFEVKTKQENCNETYIECMFCFHIIIRRSRFLTLDVPLIFVPVHCKTWPIHFILAWNVSSIVAAGCQHYIVFVQEETGVSMLQQEKNIRTQVEALMREKTQRLQQLKVLLEQDQDLSDILCSMSFGISPDSVPSLEQLENFRQHIASQNAEKVRAHFVVFQHLHDTRVHTV